MNETNSNIKNSNDSRNSVSFDENATSSDIRNSRKHTKSNDSILVPKDSVTALNELKPGLVYETETISNNKILATVKVDGKTFFGTGMSNFRAKQSAAEGALKHCMFDLIMSMMDDDIDVYSFPCHKWELLGSFALFKLIEEWLIFYSSEDYYKKFFEISTGRKVVVEEEENEDVDFKVEETNVNIVKTNCETKKSPNIDNHVAGRKLLPKDTNAIVYLNSLLGKNLIFKDLNYNVNKPPFTFAIFVDGVEYVGKNGRSKKEAKHNAAKEVLMKKYGYEIMNNYKNS